jgi:hypothetical protein
MENLEEKLKEAFALMAKITVIAEELSNGTSGSFDEAGDIATMICDDCYTYQSTLETLVEAWEEWEEDKKTEAGIENHNLRMEQYDV